MPKHITTEKQLLEIFSEKDELKIPRDGLLNYANEILIGVFFGLLASYIIHYFHIKGWGLQVLLFVVIFEIGTLSWLLAGNYYAQHENKGIKHLIKPLQILFGMAVIGLVIAFHVVWNIPILYWMLVINLGFHLHAKFKSEQKKLPDLMKFMLRDDGRVLTIIFTVYNISNEAEHADLLYNNNEFQERFFVVALHGLHRFYEHPNDEEVIVADLKTIYSNMIEEFLGRSELTPDQI